MTRGFLKFLSSENQQRLDSIARRKVFRPDETILSEGELRRALFVVHEGQVRVERSHMGFNIEVARLKPGEVFGEMSLVEKFGASASVIADTEVTIDEFDEEDVCRLMDERPEFAGEFYRSLAEIISRRLRETTVRSISEFSWGGYSDDSMEAGSPGNWGGGSPLRDD